MSREFPDRVNPWSAAEARREFRGSLPLSRFRRLAELLKTSDEDRGRSEQGGEDAATFEMRFWLDQDRRPRIDLEVRAELPLECQVSLEAYRHPVRRRSELGVVETEAEEKLLPSDVDPVMTDNGRLAIAALVEDELLLALPEVPRKPELETVIYAAGEEPAADDVVERRARKPFAALGEMLAAQDEDPAQE